VSHLSRRGAVVAGVVAAVVSLTVASASALAPPPSSPAPTGPDLSLVLRTDSVVATATLRSGNADEGQRAAATRPLAAHAAAVTTKGGSGRSSRQRSSKRLRSDWASADT
jgi:hypothetical protein